MMIIELYNSNYEEDIKQFLTTLNLILSNNTNDINITSYEIEVWWENWDKRNLDSPFLNVAYKFNDIDNKFLKLYEEILYIVEFAMNKELEVESFYVNIYMEDKDNNKIKITFNLDIRIPLDKLHNAILAYIPLKI